MKKPQTDLRRALNTILHTKIPFKSGQCCFKWAGGSNALFCLKTNKN